MTRKLKMIRLSRREMADNEKVLELIDTIEWTAWMYGHLWQQKQWRMFESTIAMLNGRLI